MNTPRTDANESLTCKEGDLCIAPDFARLLETELIAMTALADRLAEASKACFDALERIGWPNEAETLREALAAYENHKKGNTP